MTAKICTRAYAEDAIARLTRTIMENPESELAEIAKERIAEYCEDFDIKPPRIAKNDRLHW